jgi:mannosyltransferase
VDRLKIGLEIILLIIIIAVGLAARFHEVCYNLDGDEIFSVELASKSFGEVISRSLQDTPHPPLHNILLHLWIKVFGASEASVRALSVLFSGVSF